MAKLVELNLRPAPKTLREFGIVALVGFGVLALLAFTESGPFRFGLGEAKGTVALGLGGLALFSGLCALAFPLANLPLYVLLTVVFFPVGYVVSHLLMFALFFAVIGPIALVRGLVQRDPMHIRYDRSLTSYFTPPERPHDKSSYFKQF